jgi:hypothetical protein
MKGCVHEFDVVVAGGGPAGIAATLAAARQGARVALIEGASAFGGMATTGLVPAFCPFGNGVQCVIRGIGLEILRKGLAAGACLAKHEEGVERFDWVRINPEKLKALLDELLAASGATLRLFTQATEPVVAHERIAALRTWSKSGLEEWRAPLFVDCTGDADIAARAGCPCEQGDAEGRLQPTTLCFAIEALRGEARALFEPRSRFTALVRAASGDGRLSGRFDHHSCASRIVPDGSAVGFNYKHQERVDGTSAAALTTAIMQGRRQAAELCALLRSVPGGEEARVACTASLVGVRETRRILGDYRMDVEHFWNCTLSPDDIASYCYYIDIHEIPGDEPALARREREAAAKALPPGRHYGIPYRALLPRGIDNLLVAGRAISCDRAMHGSVRVMPAAFATGEAAGVAASMAAAARLGTRAIDTRKLRARLVAQGAFIEGATPA